MFDKIRNIETAFKSIRLFCIILVVGTLFTCGIICWLSLRSAERAQNRIYVLSAGKVLEATASFRQENIAVEAKDHIKSFHEYLFTLGPDERLINENVTRALYLADESANRFYKDCRENGFYSNIISGNISQEIKVDSIDLDMTLYPWTFKCVSTQRIIRSSSTVTRSLVTTGCLRTISRSEHNSHGLMIERWSVLSNPDIKVEKR